MDDCIFCKMSQKKIPSRIAYEDSSLFAFYDVHPQAPIHILITPKKHIARIYDLHPPEGLVLSEMIFLANQLAKENKIDKNGYRLVINCNPEGGQTVYHIHLHLLGGRDMKWPPG
ncbi:MAG: histidine triad nucleotide-binding protein [Chlamydiae bacterium]|nr:histidine triad nucleotide-binding protein [Chlamydiota bacterium]MBI3276915.1 histidine triad nucleotide-binding protein [Chlamydiota bacterium]